MTNLRITFSYPWLLLLFIPALGVALWYHLRLNKKYRRTRNLIVSMTLHIMIMLFSVVTLAGIAFAYDEPNTQHEVIILVDKSYSALDTSTEKDAFIKTTLDESNSDFKIGIVTFGKNQVEAAKLNNDIETVWEEYNKAQFPDNRASNIADALLFAADLFTGAGGRIILLSDGIETDSRAMAIILTLVSKDISVDTVHFDPLTGSEVQVIGIQFPDVTIVPDEAVDITVKIQSSMSGTATVDLYVNDQKGMSVDNYSFSSGVNSVVFKYTFKSVGLQKIMAVITPHAAESTGLSRDTLSQNNRYYSYVFLTIFNQILIVDGGNESETLIKLLKEVQKEQTTESFYDITVVTLSELPATLDELRLYDQVILMNVANRDLSEGFVGILHEYVNVLGGGLLTVGGDRAYNRDDMVNSVYQKMLPVECINYVPPLGVAIVIDRSGSTEVPVQGTSKTRLELAIESAREIVAALNERDYVGILTFETGAQQEMELIPQPQRVRAYAALDRILAEGSVGGTEYIPAIEATSVALQGISDRIQVKNVIFISDGEPSEELEDIIPVIRSRLTNHGIRLSAVHVGDIGSGQTAQSAETIMRTMAEEGNGYFVNVTKDVENLPAVIREIIRQKDLSEYIPETFTPRIDVNTAIRIGLDVTGLEPSAGNVYAGIMPNLGGFYGTRTKSNAQVLLYADIPVTFIPIYAQWNFGNGKVGSFMCDLNGSPWSNEFLEGDNGKIFIKAIVKGLFPRENIRSHEINYKFAENTPTNPVNFTTQLNIDTDVSDGSTISLTVIDPLGQSTFIVPSEAMGQSRATIAFDQSGLYEVVIQKRKPGGDVVVRSAFITFSYSSEFNMFFNSVTGTTLLENLAENSDGDVFTIVRSGEVVMLLSKKEGDIFTVREAVFRNFEITTARKYDPRIPFMITAIILFLLDIAVRKFKFRWPWEIVRDNKLKKELKNNPKSV